MKGQHPNTDGAGEKESSSCSIRNSQDETISNDSELHSEMAALRPDNQFPRDPHEVLRASLEFQQSSRRLEQQRYSSSRLPPRGGSDSSLITSTSSLYPSLESVHRAASELNFEADWSSANVSERNTEATTSQDAATPLIQAVTSSEGELHTSISIPVAASSTPTEAAAEVTMIEDERIHPLEVESVVQAELVNEGANDHELVPESATDQIDQQGAATEATVIASGPPEKATIAAWSGDSTEAVTLPQESFTTQFESVDDLDAEKSSLQNETRAEFDALSDELSSRNLLTTTSENADGDMFATVVDNGQDHSAQAELVANVTTNDLVSEGVAVVSSSGDDNDPNVATEATVLDCGPPEKATLDAWSSPEEAQVLSGDYTPNVSAYIEDEELKPSACINASARDVSSSGDDNTEIRDTSQNSENQAEIVEISDHIHPLEFEMENATTAQLIGNPEGIFTTSDNIHTEHTIPDFFTEENTGQAPLIASVESQNDVEDDAGSQDMKLPATIHEDEIIPLATIDGEEIEVHPPIQAMETFSDSLDNGVVLAPMETSAIESEVLGVFSLDTPSISEYTETPLVPEPRPFASPTTNSSTSNRTSTGSLPSSERSRSDSALRGVQVVSICKRIDQKWDKAVSDFTHFLMNNLKMALFFSSRKTFQEVLKM